MKNEKMQVFVMKDGVVKEIRDLPKSIKDALSEAYDKEPAEGLTKEECLRLSTILKKQMESYQEQCKARRADSSMVDFAEAMNIYSETSPLMVDLLNVIDFYRRACPELFNVNMLDKDNLVKYLEALNKQEYTYEEIEEDYAAWIRKIGKHISSILSDVTKFCKFYYLISSVDLTMVSV